MKLLIDGKSYELTDECIAGLLVDLKKMLLLSNAKLPSEIQAAVDRVTSLSDDSLLHLVQIAKEFGMTHYLDLPTPKRIGTMTIARTVIGWAEKKFGEAARILRPPKKVDPIEHVVSVIYPVIEKAVPLMGETINNVTIECHTKGKSLTCIQFHGENRTRGSLVIDGNIGLRENHSRQDDRQIDRQALSGSLAPLYSGYAAQRGL